MQYKVIYSERKTVAISIENCEAVVKAPIGTDEETIRKIVLKHSQWIEKHMEQQKRKKI